MSLSPSNRLGLLIARSDAALARDPKRRRAIAVEMSKKLQAMKLGIEDNCIVDPRTVRERDSEQAARQASKADELIKGGMDEWVAHNAAGEEAAEWRRAEDEKQAIEHATKGQLLRKLRSLDAMLSVLPPELRAEVGGFVQLAQFPTDEARLKEIGRRTEKMSTVVERFLADENRDSIEPSLEQAPMMDGSPLPDTPVLRNPASVLSSSSVLAFGMAAWCIVLAAVDFHALWPYELSKWAICAGSIVLARHFEKGSWRFLFGYVLAVIFNPIAPIHFGKGWPTVNICAAVSLIAIAPSMRCLTRKEPWIRAKHVTGRIASQCFLVLFVLWGVFLAGGVIWHIITYDAEKEAAVKKERTARKYWDTDRARAEQVEEAGKIWNRINAPDPEEQEKFRRTIEEKIAQKKKDESKAQ